MNPSEGLKNRENQSQQRHGDQSEQMWGSGESQKSCLPQEILAHEVPPTSNLHLLKGIGDPTHGFTQWAAVSTH